MTTCIHIIGGDLEMLASAIDSIQDEFRGLDAVGVMNSTESAMPASASSGVASEATSVLDDLKNALAGRYGRMSSGTRDLISLHRSNDEAVAATLPHPPEATAESVSQWAHARGLA